MRNSLSFVNLALKALNALKALCFSGHCFDIWFVSVRTQRPQRPQRPQRLQRPWFVSPCLRMIFKRLA